MTYEELQELGRAMKPEEIDANLVSLMSDPRWPALIATIDRNWKSFAGHGSRQDIAADHGKITHCMGSVHAFSTLENQLRALIAPPTRRRQRPPEQ